MSLVQHIGYIGNRELINKIILEKAFLIDMAFQPKEMENAKIECGWFWYRIVLGK